MGFEPMARCRVTGFQDQLLKPLGHLSIYAAYRNFQLIDYNMIQNFYKSEFSSCCEFSVKT